MIVFKSFATFEVDSYDSVFANKRFAYYEAF